MLVRRVGRVAMQLDASSTNIDIALLLFECGVEQTMSEMLFN